jgi:hypothetical protein
VNSRHSGTLTGTQNSAGANPARGEAALVVGGEAVKLRPSFEALVAAEEELGPLFALVERAAAGGLKVAEMAALFWHCAAGRPDGLTRERIGQAIEAGQCWIVAVGATGAWEGQDGLLASWTDGGWRFVAPAPGTSAWNKAASVPLLWDGTQWHEGDLGCTRLIVGGLQVVGARQAGVPSPSGGTIIDAEARAAINALIATLMSHGLIE